MTHDSRSELYQQVIIEHNKNPKNFRRIPNPTHEAEGYNPLCGDHIRVYLVIGQDNLIKEISFEGSGCAISKASASMMTSTLKGMKIEDAQKLFEQFHRLVTGELDPGQEENTLGKLAVFSGIWHFPARVKCAILSWHTMKGALEHQQTVSTE